MFPTGGDNNAHNLYAANGLTEQAADYVAGKLGVKRADQSVDQASGR